MSAPTLVKTYNFNVNNVIPAQGTALAGGQLLDSAAVIQKGNGYIGWTLNGESAYVISVPGGLIFRSYL